MYFRQTHHRRGHAHFNMMCDFYACTQLMQFHTFSRIVLHRTERDSCDASTGTSKGNPTSSPSSLLNCAKTRFPERSSMPSNTLERHAYSTPVSTCSISTFCMRMRTNGYQLDKSPWKYLLLVFSKASGREESEKDGSGCTCRAF